MKRVDKVLVGRGVEGILLSGWQLTHPLLGFLDVSLQGSLVVDQVGILILVKLEIAPVVVDAQDPSEPQLVEDSTGMSDLGHLDLLEQIYRY